PSHTDTAQDQGERGAGPACGALLVHLDLVPETNPPRDSPSLADSSKEGTTDSEREHPVAPASKPLETACLPPGRTQSFQVTCPKGYAYTLKWNLCPIRQGLEFLRGARRLNLPQPHSAPSWNLSLVLRALQQGPFEPLQSVKLKFLSMKTLLLLALASIKRVEDLHAFSVESYQEFGPADSQVILRPWPGYMPK
ncbi:hypothetical protein M9458_009132, partial [Cirrhinus mrigala]